MHGAKCENEIYLHENHFYIILQLRTQPRFETEVLSIVTRKQPTVTQTKSKGHTYTNPRPGQYLKDAHRHIPGQWHSWIAVSMPLIHTGIDLIFYLILSIFFFFTPNNSIRGQCRFAVQQEALAAGIQNKKWLMTP